MTKKLFINSAAFIIVASLTSVKLMAQNSSPYWSLAGNNNTTSASKLGTTNSTSLRFYTNNVQRMIINSAGFVGIGTGSPVNILTVKSSGGTPAGVWLTGLNSPIFTGFSEDVSSELVLASASNTTNRRSVFQGRRSRGTLTAPTVVANNDYITSLLASAYDGSTFQNPALISFFVDGTPSAGNVPTRISFVTGSNAGNRTERLKVGSTGNFNFNSGQLFLQQSNGNVGIGTTTPKYKLHVNGVSEGISMQGTSTAVSNLVYMTFRNSASSRLGYVGDGSTGDNNIFLSADLGDVVLNTSAGRVLTATNSGNVGIGTTTPGNTLHIFKGSAGGVTGFSSAPLIVENSANSYIQMLAPEAAATGILFGKPSSNLSGGIFYNDISHNPNGFDFRTNGNITQMVLTNAGALGVGTGYDIPVSKFTVKTPSNSFGMTHTDGTVLVGTYIGNGKGWLGTKSNHALAFFTNNSDEQMTLATNGNLGIGTLPGDRYKVIVAHTGYGGLDIKHLGTGNDWEFQTQYDLYLAFNGDTKGVFSGNTGSYSTISDERLKENIRPMGIMMEKIRLLKPSIYEFKNTKDKQEYNGFIAQDVIKLFPSLVKHHVIPESGIDVYTMDNSGFGVLAIKGIQELAPIVEEQKKINEEQKKEIDSIKNADNLKFAILEDRIKKLQAALETLTANKNEKTSTVITDAFLEQNIPNPFKHNTTIGYSLPVNFTKAEIKITDKNGKILKAINISGSGKGTLNVDASILSSGAYNYSLYVNGKLISTKQMERLK